jgi:tetratricopeptide (TPR) repeat protein
LILLSFFVFFALYAGAAFPSFGGADAAELLAAAASNGVPPPPAQGLAWLLAKIAFWIPLGNPAYRTNLMAAALMAGAVPLVAGILDRLAPPRSWAPFAHQEIERDRWRATACWLTAFLWALSPGPWRCALSLGADTMGLFLMICAFAAGLRPPAPTGKSAFPWTTCLAAAAVSQWPAALWALPGLGLAVLSVRPRDAAPLPFRRTAAHAGAAAAGALPALIPLLLSRAAPALDAGSPDGWTAWIRYALHCPPFFPPALEASRGAVLARLIKATGDVYTWPGAALFFFGFFRMARSRWPLFQTAVAAAVLPGPLLFLWARPAANPSSLPQAAAWGLCALGLAVPFLWGFHRAGARLPAARAALALLLPLSLAGRLPLAARGDLSFRDGGENLLKALPSGALLWSPGAPGPVFHAQYVQGRRPDLLVARRPDTLWGRAEFRRRHPAGGPALPMALSPELFFLDAARLSGPDGIFTDGGGRLPQVDPATGLAAESRDPEDVFPLGSAFRFFPSESHRLVAPAAQLSVAKVPLWAQRDGDPAGSARDHMALSRKLDQYGLSSEAEEEALAALALDPGQPDAHRRLGEGALSRGHPAPALYHFRQALRRAPRDAEVLTLAGRAAGQTGDRAAAVKAFQSTLSLDGSREAVRRELAGILEEENRWPDAAAHWRLLMDQNPGEALYPWRLAKAEASAGHSKKARAALREYLMFPLSERDKEEAEILEKSLGSDR